MHLMITKFIAVINDTEYLFKTNLLKSNMKFDFLLLKITWSVFVNCIMDIQFFIKWDSMGEFEPIGDTEILS